MKHKTLTLALLVATTATTAAHGQELLTIFGIPFNQPITLPECPWKKVRDYSSRDRKATKPEYDNTYFSKALCYTQRSNIGQPVKDGIVNFVFPLSKEPSLGRLSGRVTNGLLARMEISTHGTRSQVRDFEALVAKFGDPTILKRPTVQNRMGASFETIEAEWKLPNAVTVTYGSALTRIDDGIVIITTPEGERADDLAHQEFMRKYGGTEL